MACSNSGNCWSAAAPKYYNVSLCALCGQQVQDLTPAQLDLFSYLGRAGMAQQGYVFAGDTAQTIARGVGFRFEDIR